MSKFRCCLTFLLCACGPVSVPDGGFFPMSACELQQGVERRSLPGNWDIGASSPAVHRLVHDAGVTLLLDVVRADGHLFAQLHEPLVSGSLPRESITALGCSLPDQLAWKALSTGQRIEVTGTFERLDGGTAAGDTLTFGFHDLRSLDGGTLTSDFQTSLAVH